MGNFLKERAVTKINWKMVLCGSYLLVQVAFVVGARFSQNRYFAWAPHDIQTEYFLEVYSENHKMDNIQLKRRYGLGGHGWMDLPPSHIKGWLTEYERQEPLSKTEYISFAYCVNGIDWEQWTWGERNNSIQ